MANKAAMCVRKGGFALMQMLDGETWAAARDDVMRSVGAMVRAGDFEQATATIGELMLFCRSRRFHPVLNEDLSASNKEAAAWLKSAVSGLERNGAPAWGRTGHLAARR
jgi:hypothetical protein